MKNIYTTLLIFVLVSCNSDKTPLDESTGNHSEDSTEVAENKAIQEAESLEALEDVQREIQAFFETKAPEVRYFIDEIELYSSEVLPRAYINKVFQPLWLKNRKETKALIENFIDYLENIKFHGFDKNDYHFEKISEYYEEFKSSSYSESSVFSLAKLDIYLSDAYLLLSSHLYHGKYDPENLTIQYGIQRGKPELELDLKLYKATSFGDFYKTMEVFYPQSHGYKNMVEKAKEFNEIAKKDTLINIPRNYNFSNINTDTTLLKKVHTKLNLLGYTEKSFREFIRDSSLFESIIKRVQNDHGLNTDGSIGKLTFEAINTPIEEREKQLYINMERIRWLPEKQDEYRIVVNIADYTLDVMDGSDTLINMRTIVGRNFRQTPVFESNMTYLVFSPTWTVPPGILRNDILPAIKKDKGYLSKNNMIVLDRSGGKVDASQIDWQKMSGGNFPYIIRQMPGKNNALGNVKFMFPNSHSVYLHDTPSRGLFSKDERAFSSGCIRVEKPHELAKILLNDSVQWNDDRIQAAMRLSNERTVLLKRPIKVYLYYLTAWNGNNFRKDIYNRDQRKEKWFEF